MTPQSKPQPNTILIGNAYMKDTHGGYGMDIFHPDGICRCLNATVGGAAQTLVLLQEPKIITRQRTPEGKKNRRAKGDKGCKFAEDKEFTTREDGIANTLTSVQKDNLLLEPSIMNIGNIYPSGGQGGKVVSSQGIASAVMECHGEVTKVVIQKVGDRGTDNYSVHDYANTLAANPMSDRGQLVVEARVRSVATATLPATAWEARSTTPRDSPRPYA